MTFIYLSDKIHYSDKILKGVAFMKNPLILAISAVAVVTVLASPRLGFSANCTAPVISRPPNQAASYEPQFRYSPGDNLRLTDNLGETSFPEPAAPAAAVPEAPKTSEQSVIPERQPI